jgi:hypothetical protein
MDRSSAEHCRDHRRCKTSSPPPPTASAWLGVESDDFLEGFVRPVGVFVFEVEDRIHRKIPQERAEAVLEPPAGERRALAARRLAGQIELGGPPSGGAVLDLEPPRGERPRAVRVPEDGIHRELEASRLLHVLVVGDEIGALLGANAGPRAERREQQYEASHRDRISFGNWCGRPKR